MLHVTAGGWGATIGLLVVLLALDPLVSGRRPHAVGFREALAWSLFYIAVAVLFGVAFGALAGWQFGAQYLAGYVVEKSLSVDNLFVFVVIMSTFAVPAEHQQRVLTIGILLALVLRGIFIALGAGLLSAFSFMFLVFGLLLVVTAVQLFRLVTTASIVKTRRDPAARAHAASLRRHDHRPAEAPAEPPG